MTLKEIYRGCVKKNRWGVVICAVFILFWISVTRDISGGSTVKSIVCKYAVLVSCLVLLVAMVVVLIISSRDFKIYQLMYDFRTIEEQMREGETIFVPKRNAVIKAFPGKFFSH